METTAAVDNAANSTLIAGDNGAIPEKKRHRDGKKLRRKKRSEGDESTESRRARSSFNEGDLRTNRQSRIHVRSIDSSKAIKRFSESCAGKDERSECRRCSLQVFQMERIKAEGSAWHKNCFRCVQCNKQLYVDTYASDGGQLYCMPHHKLLLLPKAVETSFDSEQRRQDNHQVIVCESEPVQLPDDVVRSSKHVDYGLEELHNLNVRDRFSVFERPDSDNNDEMGTTLKVASNDVKRSPSILGKMKRFQNGTAGNSQHLADNDNVISDASDNEDDVVNGNTNGNGNGHGNGHGVRQRPVSIAVMDDAKSRFEGGISRRELMREERKGELTRLRDMICGAREHKTAYEEALKEKEISKIRRSVEDLSQISSGSLKASYEKAVSGASDETEDEGVSPSVSRQMAASLASMFENGQFAGSEVAGQNCSDRSQDVVGLLRQAETARGARDLFRLLDTDGAVDTAVQQQNSSMVREQATGNARQVLSIFRQMEQQASAVTRPEGRKPLKSFTPPPEGSTVDGADSDCSSDDYTYTDDDSVGQDSVDSDQPRFHLQGHDKSSDATRNLTSKFERWEERMERENAFNVKDECRPGLDTTKNLKAMFENMKDQPATVQKAQPKVRRFI